MQWCHARLLIFSQVICLRDDSIAVSQMRFDAFVTSDVMTSPDFGLAVLGLCGPRIAFYPKCLQCFCSGEGTPSDDEEGKPPIILTLLPIPLFFAQWGLLWSVFAQSVQDCKCCEGIRVLSTLSSRTLDSGQNSKFKVLICFLILYHVAVAGFVCFKLAHIYLSR